MTGKSTRLHQRKRFNDAEIEAKFTQKKIDAAKSLPDAKPTVLGFDPINVVIFASGIALLFYFTSRR